MTKISRGQRAYLIDVAHQNSRGQLMRRMERRIRHMTPVAVASPFVTEVRYLPRRATAEDITAWDAYVRAKYGVTS